MAVSVGVAAEMWMGERLKTAETLSILGGNNFPMPPDSHVSMRIPLCKAQARRVKVFAPLHTYMCPLDGCLEFSQCG